MKIALADFVGTASAETQLVSLSAGNPVTIKAKIESLTAKYGRMKAKAQTPARKERMGATKISISKLKAALKVAEKEAKGKPYKKSSKAAPAMATKKTTPAKKAAAAPSDPKKHKLDKKDVGLLKDYIKDSNKQLQQAYDLEEEARSDVYAKSFDRPSKAKVAARMKKHPKFKEAMKLHSKAMDTHNEANSLAKAAHPRSLYPKGKKGDLLHHDATRDIIDSIYEKHPAPNRKYS
jgi:hypothetical protein